MSRIKRLHDDQRHERGSRLPHRSVSEERQPKSRVTQSEQKKAAATTVEPLQANRGEHEHDYIQLVLADGGVKQVPVRSASQNSVFIDWLTFTVDVPGFLRFIGAKSQSALTDDDIARAVSAELQECMGNGFGISKKNGYGMHFHKHSYVIGDSWGVFCIGHQKHDRFLVSISGEGWLHARSNAGEKLYAFLSRLNECGGDVRISRIDLAVDYYSGGPKHEEFEAAYHRGDFVRQRRHLNSKDAWPHYQVYGCIHTQRGRRAGITDAIGVRTSDLYLRRYDKGRELGAPDSEWVRVELEMKSKDTLIRLDVLILPETYFCQYPWLRQLRDSTATKMETKQKRAEIVVGSAEKIIKTQFGKYLRVLRQLASSDTELLDRLQHDDPNAWPARLAKIAPQSFKPLHKQHPATTPYVFDNELAASAFGYPDDHGYSRSHVH